MLTHEKSVVHISNQTRIWQFWVRALLCSAVFMLLGIGAIAFEPALASMSLSFMTKAWGGALILVATVTGMVAFSSLSRKIKCPRCQLRWFWYALAKDFKRDILIGYMNHCPRCNYPDDQKGSFLTSNPKKNIDRYQQ